MPIWPATCFAHRHAWAGKETGHLRKGRERGRPGNPTKLDENRAMGAHTEGQSNGKYAHHQASKGSRARTTANRAPPIHRCCCCAGIQPVESTPWVPEYRAPNGPGLTLMRRAPAPPRPRRATTRTHALRNRENRGAPQGKWRYPERRAHHQPAARHCRRTASQQRGARRSRVMCAFSCASSRAAPEDHAPNARRSTTAMRARRRTNLANTSPG